MRSYIGRCACLSVVVWFSYPVGGELDESLGCDGELVGVCHATVFLRDVVPTLERVVCCIGPLVGVFGHCSGDCIVVGSTEFVWVHYAELFAPIPLGACRVPGCCIHSVELVGLTSGATFITGFVAVQEPFFTNFVGVF